VHQNLSRVDCREEIATEEGDQRERTEDDGEKTCDEGEPMRKREDKKVAVALAEFL
jgi:hypothetical protein